MFIRSRIVTTTAALTLAAAAGAVCASVPAANAASVACGSGCMAIAAQSWGLNDVSSVASGIAGTGQDVILARAAEFSAEDFMLEDIGTVAALYGVGIVGSAVGETWPSDEAYEYIYAPDGVWSGLCLGVAATAVNGTAVSLQTCGISAKTLWVALSVDRVGSYQPLITATDTVTSTPYVLTAGSSLGAVLTTEELYLAAGTVAPSQMWANRFGVYYPYRIGSAALRQPAA
jgi:hypothetical protein